MVLILLLAFAVIILDQKIDQIEQDLHQRIIELEREFAAHYKSNYDKLLDDINA